MSKKLTPWFPPDVKPSRRGVYLRDYTFPYSYWDGKKWCIACDDEHLAATKRGNSLSQLSRWRGLAKEPK